MLSLKNSTSLSLKFSSLVLIKCGKCGCSITAEIQKGTVYYRCTKKRGTCTEMYIRQDKLEKQMKSWVKKYTLPLDFVK